jgi:hypothetical protein
MLTDEKRKLIEDNIGLVYRYLSTHGIDDEDTRADYICEFCKIIDRCEYDESLGKLSTFVWKSLDNFSLCRLRKNTTIKRTLDMCKNLPSFDDNIIKKPSNEGVMSLSEIVPNRYDYFGEIELEDFIEQVAEKIEQKTHTTDSTQNYIFQDIVNAYRYNNGFLNGAELAEKYGISRQAVCSQLRKIRKVAKGVMWD